MIHRRQIRALHSVGFGNMLDGLVLSVMMAPITAVRMETQWVVRVFKNLRLTPFKQVRGSIIQNLVRQHRVRCLVYPLPPFIEFRS